jgi:hypothetical protein
MGLHSHTHTHTHTHIYIRSIYIYIYIYIVTCSMCVCDCRRGMDWWMDLLTQWYTPLGTSNYSAIVNLHILQITSAHTKHSPACSVFNSRFLVTDVNRGDSSASCPQILPSRFLYRTDCQLSTELVAPVLFFKTSRRGPRRQHPVSPVACVTVATGKCLRRYTVLSLPDRPE